MRHRPSTCPERELDGSHAGIPGKHRMARVDVILIAVADGGWSVLIDMFPALPRPSSRGQRCALELARDQEWREEEREFVVDLLGLTPAADDLGPVAFVDCPGPARSSWAGRPGHRFDGLLPRSIRRLCQDPRRPSMIWVMDARLFPRREGWLDLVHDELAGDADWLVASGGAGPLSSGMGTIYHVGHADFDRFLGAWERLTGGILERGLPLDPDGAFDGGLAGRVCFDSPEDRAALGILDEARRLRTRRLRSLGEIGDSAKSAGQGRLLARQAGTGSGSIPWRAGPNSQDPVTGASCSIVSPWVVTDHHVGFDHGWQYPAITERHAWERARESLWLPAGTLYVGFPWATLIDTATHARPKLEPWLEALRGIGSRLPDGQRVITVCQHVYAARFAHFFEETGITDLYWSHAVREQPVIGRAVRVHPFPLYPVQRVDRGRGPPVVKRYLFSFVGASACSEAYLRKTRDLILTLLGGYPGGYVAGRDDWHYQAVVYDQQIAGRAVADRARHAARINEAEFREVMATSRFVLCPSGSGPNSIRLWEALDCGAIPVILSDDWLPPGDPALWEQAVVFCPEDAESITRLPDRLEALASNSTLMERKRKAAAVLARRYGVGDFIHDIRRACDSQFVSMEQVDESTERLFGLAEDVVIRSGGDGHAVSTLVLAWAHRHRDNAAYLDQLVRQQGTFRSALRLAMDCGSQADRLLLFRHRPPLEWLIRYRTPGPAGGQAPST